MSQKHFTNEVFLTHAVSLDLLDYLCPVHKKEVLRVDAFRDLLNKTCQQPTGAMTKEGTPLVVTPGQLVTSVSELARVWDWHRDKVRDFVNGLAEREVLTIDMHKKFMVLSFPFRNMNFVHLLFTEESGIRPLMSSLSARRFIIRLRCHSAHIIMSVSRGMRLRRYKYVDDSNRILFQLGVRS